MSTSNHVEKENGTDGVDHAKQRKPYDYGGNPLVHSNTGDSARLEAFGGALQPGLYRPPPTQFANPAPLGLCGFALTTFVLSLINLSTQGIGTPSIVIGCAFGYGGLVQLLAGMWEMASGNTFGATALSSFGGFWIGTAIILTPGGFNIMNDLTTADGANGFAFSFGFYLIAWFIFTFILVLCTLRSTVAFFTLFFTLDIAFLLLGIAYLIAKDGAPNSGLLKAGGVFGLLASFTAWYNAFAGIADPSNSFFLVPVVHFPWSDKGREMRNKVDNSGARAEQSAV